MSINAEQGGEDFDKTFKTFIQAGELRVPQSGDGNVMGLTARTALDSWDTQVDWVAASGRATLYSFVIYHQQYDPNRPTPYNIATVELAEGPRLISAVIIDDLSALKVGMALMAEFDGDGQLVFRPIE